MITSKKNEKSVKAATTYPAIKIHSNNYSGSQIVVAFHKESCGTVVFSDSPTHKVGEYSDGWTELNFKPFTGTLTINVD